MSLGTRIRQYRTARGFTLDELAGRMDGLVTKQALSKYEKDRAMPRPTVLVALARALDVKAVRLMGEPEYGFEIVAYRALATLPKGEAERIENVVTLELERRLTLMDRLAMEHVNPFAEAVPAVNDVRDAEYAADALRDTWDLGSGPISDVVGTLESKGVHLIDVDGERNFDGLAVFAIDEEGNTIACGVASRAETSRTRQRMNQAHEVGHLALAVSDSVDAEKAVKRFAGAFLYPATAVRGEFGTRRTRITPDELLLAKRRWGISMQAVLYRLRDLEILDELGYIWWCKRINQVGWRINEPGDEPPERSTWNDVYAHRAAAEGLIAAETLADYVPSTRAARYPGDIDRRALMKLPLAERCAIIQAQAEAFADEYNATIDHEWLDADLGERDDVDD
jgi:transcriptional regulator with XRE-family HTH domain